MLDVSITEENNRKDQIVFVNLRGGLDSEHAIDFYDFILAEVGKGYHKFIIDCTNLDYISSSGISIVLRLRNKLPEKKCILIYSSLNEEISLLFHFFGLDKNLYITKTNETAIKLAEASFFEEDKTSLDPFPSASVTAVTEPISEPELPTIVDYSNSKTYEAMEVTDPKTGSEGIESEEDIIKNRIHFTEECEDKLTEEVVALPVEPEQTEELSEESKVSEEIPMDDLATEELPEEEIRSALSEVVNATEKPATLKPENDYYEREELKITVPFFMKNDTGSSSTILDSITDFEEEDPSLKKASDEKFTMLIVNCGKCGSKIRISKQGKQMCPSCRYKFNLRQSGSISTIERIDY